MKFLDEATIDVESGGGGDGCVSFRREKYVPRGGPDGGDGGCGGDVIFVADGGLSTLMDVHYRRSFKAGKGAHGKGSQKTGACGEPRVVELPAGTIVFDANTGEKLADLDRQGMEWVAAKGGRGGRGNMRFTSSTNQAPRRADKGEAGEKKSLRLELKLLADVGLVGLPNAGKSTLISAVSNARPKIADYPFTTNVPHLGLVRIGEGANFVMADIPGLIEGAHKGAGMGLKFLRHIERTRLILHLIDTADPANVDPIANYKAIRKELTKFNPNMANRPELVVLTKMDVTEARLRQKEIAIRLKKLGVKKVFPVSAVQKEGLKELLNAVSEALKIGQLVS